MIDFVRSSIKGNFRGAISCTGWSGRWQEEGREEGEGNGERGDIQYV